MADVGFIARPRAEAVVGGDQLNEDGAEFSNATANTVAGCAVAGGEDFGRYEVCRCVGACEFTRLVHGFYWGGGDVDGRTNQS